MIRKSALAATIAALLTPAVAGALGLGNIEVTSALNEPLQARIPLRGVEAGDMESLRVGIGTDEQFRRAGLDRAFVLTKLRFEVVESSAGSGFIRVTSRDPIAEPFLNFLVDVNWPRGRVLREYTVLLDPPVYGAAISTATKRAVATVAAAPDAPRAAPPTAVTSRSAPGRPAAASPAMASGAPRVSGDSYGPVRDGETLWSIADRVRPGGVSIQNMMLALLRANPQAFNLDNVNALRTGAVLRIPSASEVAGDQAQALAAVARQHALWEEYRQSLPAAVGVQPGGAAVPPAAAAAPPAGTAAGTAGASAAPPSAELKVVGGATAGAVAGSGQDVQALRNELTLAQEEAEAAKRENQELTSRLGEVETLVGDLKRLVELKEDQLAALQRQLSQAPVASTTAPAVTPATSPAKPEAAADKPVADKPVAPKPAPTQATPAKPPVKPPVATRPVPPPPPPPPPKSFMDQVNEMLPVPLWTVLAGLGAILFGVGGIRWARGRKARKAQDAGAGVAGAAAMGAAGGSMHDQYARTELPADGDADEDVTDMPASGAASSAVDEEEDADKTELPHGDTGRLSAAPGADEDDPLAEVNVYLAYERFDQAEQLVRDAISSYPQRHEYKLKLLEVFYAAKNVASFETAARDLNDAVGDDHALMRQAHAWWQDLGAGRALFQGFDASSTQRATATNTDDMFDVTAADAGDQTGVDFDLGFDSGDGATAASNLDFDLGADDGAAGSTPDSALDFDLGGFGAEEDSTPGSGAAGTRLDFDLTSDAETPASGDTGLDFDLDGLDTGPGAGSETTELPAAAGDTGLDFDLSGLAAGGEENTLAGGAQAAADDALDFTLDDAEPGARPGVDDADGVDSGLDFDLSDATMAATTNKPEAAPRDASGTALDLDAGADDSGALDIAGQTTLSAGLSGQADAEGGLDFDLGDDAEEDLELGEAQPADTDLDLELQPDAAAQDDDAPLSLDMDLSDDERAGDFQDAHTEISDGTDLVLSLDSDDATTAGTRSSDEVDFPLLDMGDDDQPGNIATVQLSPQDGDALRARAGVSGAASEEAKQFGVDTDFRDIFASGGNDADGSGAESELDFDLGTDLGGVAQDQAPVGDDDDTQFLLEGSDEDDDDHTLVLGRGASGEVDEMQTKLDLAQAYMDMGDSEGARNLLGEVMAEGAAAQKDQAREMLTRLS